MNEKPTLRDLPRVDDGLNTNEMLRSADQQRTVLAAIRVLERMNQVPQTLRDQILERINQLNIK